MRAAIDGLLFLAALGYAIKWLLDPGGPHEPSLAFCLLLLSLVDFISRNLSPSSTKQRPPPPTAKPEHSTGPNQQSKGKESETAKLTQRFASAISMINEKAYDDAVSIPQMALELKLDKIGDLEKVVAGEIEPSLEFVREFCETFGINYKWLALGESHPFVFHRSAASSAACNYLYDLDRLEKLNPEKIYFVRNNSETGEAIVIIKHSRWKFEELPYYLHISSHVGATGTHELCEFYNAIKELRHSNLVLRCEGRFLDRTTYRRLTHGEAYPGAILRASHNSRWWIDFQDINHQVEQSVDGWDGVPSRKIDITARYKQQYGQSFLDAQKIVRNSLAHHT